MQKLGTQLNVKDQRVVLNQFCHRMTVESIARWPEFAARMQDDGYCMPIRTDKEWLAKTRFFVRRNGRLDRRFRRCETTH